MFVFSLVVLSEDETKVECYQSVALEVKTELMKLTIYKEWVVGDQLLP